MSLIGTHVPGGSPVHRLPAGPKLLALAVAEAALALLAQTPVAVGGAALVIATLYAVALVPLRVAWRQLRSVLLVAALVGLAQWYHAGSGRALVSTAQLVVAVALAVLVTVTTRTTALLDAVETGCRPLSRVGIDPARVALTLALAVRSVPVVGGLLAELREAQRARGVNGGLVTLGVPLVVRTVHHAEQLGEALAARGVDD